MTAVADIAGFLGKFAPLELAEAWDNVGLLLGDSASSVEKIMTCLTVTPSSAAEAVEAGAQLIVTHHPILFKPTQRIASDTAQGRVLLALIQAGVAVYSPHTAFDNTIGGINEMICRRIGLEEVQPLRPAAEHSHCKIIVFVPEKDLAAVSDAMFQAGAGVIGEYRECSFRLAGTGTFYGLDAAQPSVGQKGRREEVAEWRLEVICPQPLIGEAVRAMRKSHSYDEPAFDIVPLHALPGKHGVGRLGKLPKVESLESFASRVKRELNASQLHVVGDRARPIRTVAVACGAAGEFLKDAEMATADAFLTGEMRLHEYLAAEAANVALVLPGHYASERPGVEELATILQREFSKLKVWPSAREQDPAWTP